LIALQSQLSFAGAFLLAESTVTANKRVVFGSIMLAAAVCCGVAALYLFSILDAGQGRYRDLIWPTVGLAGLSACAAALAGGIWAHGRKRQVRLQATMLCIAGTALAAGSVFYGVLANCRLSQSTIVIDEKRSPDGSFIAVQLIKRCNALVGYCPTASLVRIVRPGEDARTGGTSVFESSDGGDDLILDWAANNFLRIYYSGNDRVTHSVQKAGNVSIKSLPGALRL